MAKNNFMKIVNCVAFIGLALIAIVLVLQKILSGNLTNALRLVGECMAYFVTAVSAFYYVNTKRNVWWYVAYVAILVLMVLFIIIR